MDRPALIRRETTPMAELKAVLRAQLSATARTQIPADMPQPAGPAFPRFGGRAGGARRQGPSSALLDLGLDDLIRKRTRGGHRLAQNRACLLAVIQGGLPLLIVLGFFLKNRLRLHGKGGFSRCFVLARLLDRRRLRLFRLKHRSLCHFPTAFDGALGILFVASLAAGLGWRRSNGLTLPLDRWLGGNGYRLHRSRVCALGLRRYVGRSRLKELFSVLPGLGSGTGELRRILPGRRRSRGRRGLGRNRSRTPDLDKERLGRRFHSGMYVVGESWNAGSFTPSTALGKSAEGVKCEISPFFPPTIHHAGSLVGSLHLQLRSWPQAGRTRLPGPASEISSRPGG